MQFETGVIYHIYNQGNNRGKIFFTDRNYLFFLKKMRLFLLPYADILCYCLMPNHFHWLVCVQKPSLVLDTGQTRTLNDSIAILLRSYTRAINIQEGRTGSLFRKGTKAKDGNVDTLITVDTFRTEYGDIRALPDLEYGLTCFKYIHANPVKANMVNKDIDWPYSSASDYAGLRNGTLCNQVLAKTLLGAL